MIVRVFIPTYNPDADALRKTLDSVRFSHCGNIEIHTTVIDNHSDVDIYKMVEGYPCDLVVNLTNIGRIQNWNKCLELFKKDARGRDAMKFLFVGDTMNSECLADQSRLIDRGFSLVSSAHTVYPVDKNSYVMNHSENGDMILTAKEGLVLSEVKGNWLAGCMACPMFRKDLLGGIEFDTSMSWASDWKFWTDLIARSKSIYYLAKPTVNFNAQHRAHFLATQHAIQNSEESYMRGYISDLLSKK